MAGHQGPRTLGPRVTLPGGIVKRGLPGEADKPTNPKCCMAVEDSAGATDTTMLTAGVVLGGGM